MKQRRWLGLLAACVLGAVVLAGCISDESRGWGAPVVMDDTQVLSPRKGKLDGVSIESQPSPAWTGTLSIPLSQNETRILSTALSPTDTPFQGDLLRIGSELVRVRSLSVNGAEREMHLDRGFGGTTASAHAAGTEVEAVRRAWRFPDDWHIREGGARNLGGVYGAPIADDDGVMYVGDYRGWLYAFMPEDVNLDATTENDEPKVALANLDNPIIGGLALDEASGLLYVTAGDELFAVSTGRLKAALAAGGGVIDPEPGFRFKASDGLWSSPVVEDGVVYVASLDGNLYALNAASGSVNWSFDGGQGLMTTPVVVDDVVLVGGFEATLFGVDKASGAQAWALTVSNWIFSTPVIDGDLAYFGDFDGILHAVNVGSGTEAWSLPLNRGKIRAAVAVSGDVAVVGTDEGWLIGVNRTTQQRVWEVELGSDILADLVADGSEVLMAPQGCSTLPGGEVQTYYRAVEAETGTLRRVEGLC